MSRKQYTHLSSVECVLLRQRYVNLLKAYYPKMYAQETVLEEFNISKNTFYRILQNRT